MEEKAQEVKKENKAKKVVSIVLNTIFYAFIVLLLFFSISNLAGKEDNVPKLFGRYFMAVRSNSMDGNNKDSFKAGDLVVAKVATDKLIAEIEIGDVITFYDKSIDIDNAGNQFNTHRVVDILKDSETGELLSFICQGDYVQETTPQLVYDKEAFKTNYAMQQQCQIVPVKNVRGVYGSKVKNLGNALFYLRSEQGFALCIILPTALLFILEAFFLVRNILAINKEKMANEMAGAQAQQAIDLEAEKERMRQEILAELAKQNGAKAEEEPAQPVEENEE